MKKKLTNVLARDYISLSDDIKLLTHFFSVPKTWKITVSKRVPGDIRVVYDSIRLEQFSCLDFQCQQ